MGKVSTQIDPANETSLAAKGCGSVVLLMFIVIGLTFAGFLVSDFLDKAAAYNWPPTPCDIVAAEATDEPPYELKVTFTYAVGDVRHTASETTGYSDYSKLQRRLHGFATGGAAACYVNPQDPAHAVLERPSLWFGLAVFLPLIFVAIGVGGMIALWRSGRRPASDPTRAITANTKSPKAAAGLALFFSIFFLAGVGFMMPFFVLPVLGILDARAWTATPCTIVHSEVQAHRDDDGTTYSVEMLYEYEFAGRTYRSNRYQFMTASTSGRDGKAEVVRDHAPGTTTTCYVNPDDPYEAVIHRGFVAGMLFGLIPLIFVAVGLIGMTYSIRSMRRTADRARSAVGERRDKRFDDRIVRDPDRRDASDDRSGPVTLKSTSHRWAALIGVTLFAAFWNGIVSVFLFEVVDQWSTGHSPWFETLFLTPFVLIGLGVLFGVLHTFLALFNPRPTLTLNQPSIPLGGTLDLQWRLAGSVRRINRFRITLIAREEATYRRGTDTVTDKQTFLEMQLVETDHPRDIADGAVSVTIPPQAMHSFEADHNKIVWQIEVRGTIRRWPDVSDDFPIRIDPAPAEDRAVAAMTPAAT